MCSEIPAADWLILAGSESTNTIYGGRHSVKGFCSFYEFRLILLLRHFFIFNQNQATIYSCVSGAPGGFKSIFKLIIIIIICGRFIEKIFSPVPETNLYSFSANCEKFIFGKLFYFHEIYEALAKLNDEQFFQEGE